MQDLFKNYKLEIEDYDLINKSNIWSKILNYAHKGIDEKKLENFFSNSLSDGICNSRLISVDVVKKNFLSLCKKYQIDEIIKLLTDENNNVGNLKNYYSLKDKIISYQDPFLINFYFEIEKFFSSTSF